METLPATVQAKPTALIPTDFESCYRMAKIMSASGLMPKQINTPEAVFVAMQMGAEIGLSPMASVQNIAVINGKPGIYGDAALAVVRASGLLEEFKEWSEGERKTPAWIFFCRLKRKGFEAVTGSFSWSQACDAGLDRPHPDSPWRKWTDRMMQFKARNFPMRDQFADILKGIRTSEENHDAIDAEYTIGPATARDVVPAMVTLKDKLNDKIAELAGKPHTPEPVLISPPEQNPEETKPADVATVDTKAVENDPWADFRSQFINLKGAGFSTFVFKNKDRLKECPPEIQKEAIEKWVKLYPGNPYPLNAETEQRTNGNGQAASPTSSEPPVSFSKEYKQMMELKSEFPVFYAEAVKELNVSPDTVVNCVNIAAMIGRKIDQQADNQPPVDAYEPPVDAPDTSGF
jgi:hypothetical protein